MSDERKRASGTLARTSLPDRRVPPGMVGRRSQPSLRLRRVVVLGGSSGAGGVSPNRLAMASWRSRASRSMSSRTASALARSPVSDRTPSTWAWRACRISSVMVVPRSWAMTGHAAGAPNGWRESCDQNLPWGSTVGTWTTTPSSVVMRPAISGDPVDHDKRPQASEEGDSWSTLSLPSHVRGWFPDLMLILCPSVKWAFNLS